MKTFTKTLSIAALLSIAACNPPASPPPSECGVVAQDLVATVGQILQNSASWESDLVALAAKDGWAAVLCAVKLFEAPASNGGAAPETRARAAYFAAKYEGRS